MENNWKTTLAGMIVILLMGVLATVDSKPEKERLSIKRGDDNQRTCFEQCNHFQNCSCAQFCACFGHCTCAENCTCAEKERITPSEEKEIIQALKMAIPPDGRNLNNQKIEADRDHNPVLPLLEEPLIKDFFSREEIH